MWLYCMGMPRSARKWVFNIVRELRSQDRKIDNSGYFTDPKELEKYCLNKNIEHHINLFEISFLTKEISKQISSNGKAKAICSYRDPRDVVVSLSNFINSFVGFEELLNHVVEYTDFVDKCNKYPGCLLVNYQSIMEQPSQTIKHIANHLDISATEDYINHLAKQYSLENIKEFVSTLETLPSEDVDYVNGRLVHKQTLYMKGHIQSGNTRQWLHWSTEQSNLARKHLGQWLIQYGFEKDLLWVADDESRFEQQDRHNSFQLLVSKPGFQF